MQAVVNTGFLNGQPFWAGYQQSDYNYTLGSEEYASLNQIQELFSSATKNGTTTMHPVINLTNSECMATYGTSFVSEYSSVLAVTNAKGNFTNETLFYETESIVDIGVDSTGSPSYVWICTDKNPYQQFCDVGSARKNAANWYLNNYKIEYCLAQVAEPYISLLQKQHSHKQTLIHDPSRHCKLQFSLQSTSPCFKSKVYTRRF